MPLEVGYYTVSNEFDALDSRANDYIHVTSSELIEIISMWIMDGNEYMVADYKGINVFVYEKDYAKLAYRL